MPDSLAELERRRTALTQQIGQLGDLRAGCITGTSGRCGKPNCHCHQPGQPGHGPNLRLTYKVAGKTISESLPDSAAVDKAEREVAAFRNFQQLRHEFVQVNARICHLRPVEEQSPATQEKKRPTRFSKKSRTK